ncbi:hypothetical protein JVU11DRAFT_416 [Chiua virens]|nr:hypothetical protein JVU11DRAFT_416 [Chiua virens]
MTVHDETPPSNQNQQGSPLYAALARTTTRGIALYFSRPVRLFRPSKVSGWHSLRGHANRHGTTLSRQYIISLVKSQGVVVLPARKCVRTDAYITVVHSDTEALCAANDSQRIAGVSEFSRCSRLHYQVLPPGGVQAVAAAPVENIRVIIEGGKGKGWSHAWKDVFLGTQPTHITKRSDQIKDIRQLRFWMKDVSEMAGRGWAGWGWGFGKDVCGFTAFFTVFEITRTVARNVKIATYHLLRSPSENETTRSPQLPRFTHAFTLVGGGIIAGLVYEYLCKPWDVARRTITLEKTLLAHPQSFVSVLVQKLERDGIRSFFREPASLPEHSELRSHLHRRISSTLRTLSRVGPWGVGFLVWESFGPGLD